MKQKQSLFRNTKHGFTLVELLVVISIIALLLSILMPALQKARQQAQQLVCKTRLKQLGTAMSVYVSMFNKYPSYLLHPNASDQPGGLPFSEDLWMANYGGNYITWEVMLTRAGCVPKVKRETWDMAVSSPTDIHTSQFWRCPSEPYPRKNGFFWPTTLSHQFGLNNMFSPQTFTVEPFCWPTGKIRQDSEKLMISEVDPAYKRYGSPTLDPSVGPDTIYFRHKKRSQANVLFMDGHVGQVDKTDPKVKNGTGSLWNIRRERAITFP